MAHSGEPTIGGGGTDPRSLRDTPAGTDRGAPDHAVAPEQRTLPEQIEFADSPEGRRIEQKLRAEALARRGDEEEEAAIDDPTGHA
jgi:hypothetical protein